MLNDHFNLLGSDRTLVMPDHRNVTVHLNPTHRSQFLCTMVGRIFGRSKDPVAGVAGVLDPIDDCTSRDHARQSSGREIHAEPGQF
jgi:hypothetical protein